MNQPKDRVRIERDETVTSGVLDRLGISFVDPLEFVAADTRAFIRTIVNKPIKVQYLTKKDFVAATDRKTVWMDGNLAQDESISLTARADITKGALLDELGHVLWTKLTKPECLAMYSARRDVSLPYVPKLAEMAINLVEDHYIVRRLLAKYPGFLKTHYATAAYYMRAEEVIAKYREEIASQGVPSLKSVVSMLILMVKGDYRVPGASGLNALADRFNEVHGVHNHEDRVTLAISITEEIIRTYHDEPESTSEQQPQDQSEEEEGEEEGSSDSSDSSDSSESEEGESEEGEDSEGESESESEDGEEVEADFEGSEDLEDFEDDEDLEGEDGEDGEEGEDGDELDDLDDEGWEDSEEDYEDEDYEEGESEDGQGSEDGEGDDDESLEIAGEDESDLDADESDFDEAPSASESSESGDDSEDFEDVETEDGEGESEGEDGLNEGSGAGDDANYKPTFQDIEDEAWDLDDTIVNGGKDDVEAMDQEDTTRQEEVEEGQVTKREFIGGSSVKVVYNPDPANKKSSKIPQWDRQVANTVAKRLKLTGSDEGGWTHGYRSGKILPRDVVKVAVGNRTPASRYNSVTAPTMSVAILQDASGSISPEDHALISRLCDILVNGIRKADDGMSVWHIAYQGVGWGGPTLTVTAEPGKVRKVNARQATNPGGGTPTYEAIAKATQLMRDANVSSRKLIVLITDGAPNGGNAQIHNWVQNNRDVEVVQVLVNASFGADIQHTVKVQSLDDSTIVRLISTLNKAIKDTRAQRRLR